MSLKMWLPLNEFDEFSGNNMIINNGIDDYEYNYDNSSEVTLPYSAEWYSVCYGNGKFVAVAYDSNTAAYSTDGINWIETTLPSSADWWSVCYGNGKFVAAGNDKAAYSTDGIHWTAAT